MKRIGLWFALIAAGVLGIEITLSVLRQRGIEVQVRIEDERGSAVASEAAATPEPDGSTPSFTLSPDGVLVVDVRWTYRVGPRFPVTVVRAQVQDESGQVVATQTHTIDCGRESFNCYGETPIRLRYGEQEGTEQAQAQPWPAGTYSVTVTRSDTAVAARQLVTQPFVVAARN